MEQFRINTPLQHMNERRGAKPERDTPDRAVKCEGVE